MIQKIIDSNIDKNTEKEAEEIFYSESNMKYLEKIITDIESGKAKLVEHNLIEGYRKSFYCFNLQIIC